MKFIVEKFNSINVRYYFIAFTPTQYYNQNVTLKTQILFWIFLYLGQNVGKVKKYNINSSTTSPNFLRLIH